MIKSSLLILNSQVFSLGINLASTVFLARYMTVDEFATIAIFQLLAQLFSMLGALGLETVCVKTIPRFLNSERMDLIQKYVSLTFASKMVSSLTCFALIFGFQESLLDAFSLSSVSFLTFTLMSISAAVISLLDFSKNILKSMKRFGVLAYVSMISDLFSRIAAIAGFFWAGVDGYWIGILISSIFSGFLIISHFKGLRGAIELRRLRRLLRLSFPFFLNGITRGIILKGDEALIGLIFNPVQLNSYNLAKRLFAYLKLLFEAIITPYYVEFFSLKNRPLKDSIKTLNQINQIGILLVCLPAMSIAVLHREIFFIYAGEKYLEYSFLITWIMFYSTAYIFSNVLGIFIFAKRSSLMLMNTEIFYGALCLVGIYSFGTLYGVRYAPLALTVSTIVSVGSNYYLIGVDRKAFHLFLVRFGWCLSLFLVVVCLGMLGDNIAYHILIALIPVVVFVYCLKTWWGNRLIKSLKSILKRR